MYKRQVGSYSYLLELCIVFNGGCSYVDVHPADFAVLELHIVYGPDALEDVINGAIYRVLSGFERQTFMSHVLKYLDLLAEFVHCELLPVELVRTVVSTVLAAVHTVVADV